MAGPFDWISDLFKQDPTYNQGGVTYLKPESQQADGSNLNVNGLGSTLNDMTGVTASNEFNSAQAQLSRDFTTSERLAAQEYNSAEALKQREFTSAEAQVARDWQMQFDNTAVQRRMADLYSAGVNPMLAVGNSISAGSAGGATASGSSAASISPGSGQAASSSGNSASAVASIIRSLTALVKVAGA